MDTADTPRPRHELVRLTDLPPALRTPILPASQQPSASGGGLPITPRLVLRGLARHWWQALLLWIIGSAALATLVYLKYEPTYRSSSQLLINPDNTNPYGNNQELTRGFADPRLQTHLNLVTSPRVLQAVIRDPEVSKLQCIREADDPEVFLLDLIKVTPGKSGALVIDIAAETQNPHDAAVIVNAVVDAFRTLDKELANARTRKAIEALTEYRDELARKVEQQEAKVKMLAEQADPEMILRNLGVRTASATDETETETESSNGPITVAASEYKKLHQELLDLEYAEIEARSELEAVRRQAAATDPRVWVERRIEQAFLANEDVRTLREALRDLDVRLNEARRNIRNPGDPALNRLQADRQRLMERYDQLWADLEPALRAQLAVEESNPAQLVRRAEEKLLSLEYRRALVQQKLDRVRLDERSKGVASLEMSFEMTKLDQQRKMHDLVDRRLESLEFESRGVKETFVQIAPAKPSTLPQVNKRDKFMAVTPLAMLGLVLGLVTLVEMRSGRVSGADELSSRVGAEVFSVPPLPTVRSNTRGRLEGPARDPKFEQFVQQLDHVRVALCGEGGDDGRGRCVLITSAVGGEGKTTLAAQLAVRCAEAGASTVLIDADLRRATLGRLFEVPDCPGLSDVLRGDASLEDALVPINQVGGCQLLPAGSPEANPNRILRGKNFAPMLERLRRSFDVVIIDTSPVLPVPDALILGRLADGAVIATRHDQSRFPAVERANSLLTSAGIPVLGVVVNGARPSGSGTGGNNYYAAYTYRSDRVPGTDGATPTG